MDNVFFRKAMPEEHIMVLTNEKRLTKLELLILFAAVISFIMDLAVLIDFLFLGNTFWTNLPNSRTGRGEYTVLHTAFGFSFRSVFYYVDRSENKPAKKD